MIRFRIVDCGLRIENISILQRQKNIGNYIVDIYCPAAKLIVEVDGEQHYVSENIQKDEIRDNYLNSLDLLYYDF